MNNNLKFLLFNFIGLQVTWAACAYGATHSFPSLGLLVGLLYVIAHFVFSKQRLRDLKIMLIIATLGIIIDMALTKAGILSFPNMENNFLPIPTWLMALWFVFSLMMPYSLYWLGKNLSIAAIAGAIGGSFSYFLGHQLGALQLSEPLLLSVGIYFIIWAIIFPAALIAVKYITNKQPSTKTIV